MKLFFVLFVFGVLNLQLFACDANCITCHPKLIKNGKMDKRHKILRKCVQCHTKKENETTHGVCGADCWSCHDIQKVSRVNIKEHRALQGCIDCHESIDKHLLEIAPQNNQMQSPSLLDTLKGM